MRGAERVTAVELLGQGEIWVDSQGVTHKIDEMEPRYLQHVRAFLLRNGRALAEQAYARVAFGPQPSGDMACDAVDAILRELEEATLNPEPWLERSALIQALDARLNPAPETGAEKTYVDQVRDRLVEEFPKLATSKRRDLLDLYALLVMTSGEWTTVEHVHDAWSLRASRVNPGHPSIVPFSELSEQVQARDLKYATVIRRIAHELGSS